MPRTTTQVRDAREQDLAALHTIEQSCFVSYYAGHRFTPQQFLYYINSPGARVRVATYRSDVVGDLVGIFYAGVRRHVTRIHSLAVLHDYRRRGIGKRLVSDFIQLSRRRDRRVIMLDIAARNRSVRELVMKLGFRTQRRIDSYYANGVDAIRMRLSL